jgi:hypothetical protein
VGDERTQVAQELIANGISASTVSAALAWLNTTGKFSSSSIWGVLSVVSAAASGYHGYKRNGTIGGAMLWFVLGGLFPVFVPVVAVAQGFNKKKGT